MIFDRSYYYKEILVTEIYIGFPQLICDSLSKCDHDKVKTMIESGIICSGGNTMFKGFGKRLQMELDNIPNSEMKLVYGYLKGYNGINNSWNIAQKIMSAYFKDMKIGTITQQNPSQSIDMPQDIKNMIYLYKCGLPWPIKMKVVSLFKIKSII